MRLSTPFGDSTHSIVDYFQLHDLYLNTNLGLTTCVHDTQNYPFLQRDLLIRQAHTNVRKIFVPGAGSRTSSTSSCYPISFPPKCPIEVDNAPILFEAEGHQLCDRCSDFIKIEELLTPGWEYKGKFSEVAENATSCAICSLIWKIAQRHPFFTVHHKNPPHGITKLP